jgi:hypothetical protein
MAKGPGRAKGISPAPKRVTGKGLANDCFLSKSLARAKAIGQAGVMVLAACEGNQLAWEMDDTDGENSVLTYYALKGLKDSSVPRNGDGHVGVKELFDYSRTNIKDYVKKTFNADQDPVLVDLAEDRVVVKP